MGDIWGIDRRRRGRFGAEDRRYSAVDDLCVLFLLLRGSGDGLRFWVEEVPRDEGCCLLEETNSAGPGSWLKYSTSTTMPSI